MRKKENAFTLIELSIVLIIISLIISGIIGGRALIHSADLRSITSDLNKYKTSINIFRDQYDALPGDITDATSYWPVDCVNNGANPCNGDGNGILDSAYESSRAWQHLYLSSIISKQYEGQTQSVSVEVLHTNIPSGSLESIFYIYNVVDYNGRSGNNILISRPRFFVSYFFPLGGLLKSADAKIIDKKVDDGKADGGHMRAMSGRGVTGCLIGGGITGDYNLSTTTNDCILHSFF